MRIQLGNNLPLSLLATGCATAAVTALGYALFGVLGAVVFGCVSTCAKATFK